MRKKIVIVMVVLLLSCGAIAFAGEYRISLGDILDIQVWGYDDFNARGEYKGYIVRPDGKIAFPLVGDVQAAGLTPADLTSQLTAALNEYIKMPRLTVNIAKFHTTRVYVLGEVLRPGMYEIEKQHSLLDAIAIAGGHTQKAAKKNVYIIQKNQAGQPIKVNLLDLLYKGDMSQNFILSEGDVVYLTRNHKLNFAQDILPFISGAYYVRHFDADD